jgi:hypothetical protein
VNGPATFTNALKRLRTPGSAAEMPKPDDPWGAWVEYRLDRLESQQTWLMRLIFGTLVLQVGLKILEMV